MHSGFDTRPEQLRFPLKDERFRLEYPGEHNTEDCDDGAQVQKQIAAGQPAGGEDKLKGKVKRDEKNAQKGQQTFAMCQVF